MSSPIRHDSPSDKFPLPLECIRDICDCLYEEWDLKTLTVLARTSKVLQDFAIPIIYSKIGMQFWCTEGHLELVSLFPVFDPSLCHYYRYNKERPPSTLALEKLFGGEESTRYAKHVRSLTIMRSCQDACTRRADSPEVTQETQETQESGDAPHEEESEEYVPKLTYEPEQWTCLMRACSMEEKIGMMPKLTAFRWAFPGKLQQDGPLGPTGWADIPTNIVKELNRPMRRGRPLTQLCMEGSTTKEIAGYLPHISEMLEDQDRPNLDVLPPMLKNLTYLSLSGDTYYAGLNHILFAVRSTLRTLILTPEPMRSSMYGGRYSSISPDGIFNILAKSECKLNLSYLDLTCFCNMTPRVLLDAINFDVLKTLLIIGSFDESPMDTLMYLVGDPINGRTYLPNVVHLQYDGVGVRDGWKTIAMLPRLLRLDADLDDTEMPLFRSIWHDGLKDANGTIQKPRINRVLLSFREGHPRHVNIPPYREKVLARRDLADALAAHGVNWVGVRERAMHVRVSEDHLVTFDDIDELDDNGHIISQDGLNRIKTLIPWYDEGVVGDPRIILGSETAFKLIHPPNGVVRMVDPTQNNCTCIL